MKRELVAHLACPLCHGRFVLESTDVGDVESGHLTCSSCGVGFPVAESVPRLVPPDLVVEQQRTASAFGWQWQHFDEMHDEFEAQFLDWLHPLDPTFFRGKRVLDAGCGMGRHAYFAASYGADDIVALDLSAAVDTANRNLTRFPNVHVVQGDLLRPPLPTAAAGGGFDLVYSIGVLHHLPDPSEGFRSLVRFVRPGGTIAVWVYGHENNGFVRNAVEPLRRVSTWLPPTMLRTLAAPLAVGFHGLAKGVYRPLRGTPVGRALPLSEYMASVAHFSFRQNYAIVFDQLVAPSTAYIREDQLRQWFTDADLEDITVSSRHGNSWRGQARVPVA